ncbi:MAG: hypothetical protein GY699_06805 [Desulfobacteraceae bacterium]|nr:hypothetical protein [Desulfobacteraceae bacterium]
MTESIAFYTYTSVFIVFFLACLLFFLKKTSLSKLAGFLGCFLGGAGILVMMILEKRPPLFGPFECTIYIVFILSLLVVLPKHALLSNLSKDNIPGLTYIIILLILSIQIMRPAPLTFDKDFYMYDILKVLVFFNFRLIAAALFIYAAIIMNSYFLSKARMKDHEKEMLLKNTSNFLLTGIAVYLISELSGSMWCLSWFGDTWMWNKGFFKAAIIFLLVMAVFHLPNSYSKSYKTKAVLSSLPAIFTLWMVLFY